MNSLTVWSILRSRSCDRFTAIWSSGTNGENGGSSSGYSESPAAEPKTLSQLSESAHSNPTCHCFFCCCCFIFPNRKNQMFRGLKKTKTNAGGFRVQSPHTSESRKGGSHFPSNSELLSSLNLNQKIYFQITQRSVMRI